MSEVTVVEKRRRKVYVSVNLDVDGGGNIVSWLIRWEDGQIFEVDKLIRKHRASAKVGGFGICYTVRIRGP